MYSSALQFAINFRAFADENKMGSKDLAELIELSEKAFKNRNAEMKLVTEYREECARKAESLGLKTTWENSWPSFTNGKYKVYLPTTLSL